MASFEWRRCHHRYNLPSGEDEDGRKKMDEKKVEKLVQKELKWYFPTLICCWVLLAMGIGFTVYGFIFTEWIQGIIWPCYYPIPGAIGIMAVLFAVGFIHLLSVNHKIILSLSQRKKESKRESRGKKKKR